MLLLTLKHSPDYPVEAGVITPDHLQNLSLQAVGELVLVHGNRKVLLRDLFAIEGDASDGHIEIQGDCRLFKSLGAGMRNGFLKIVGDTGWHTGADLRGGKIELHGNTGDYLGAEMRGGAIRISGNGGNSVGGAYQGSRHGMRGGMIFVEGSCGHEVGSKMRRGLIAVRGTTGDYLGVNMIAGTVVSVGATGLRPGAGLKRGSLVCLDGMQEIPVNYRYSNLVDLTFIKLLSKFLERHGFAIPRHLLEHPLARYCGDLLALGKGEILVPQAISE